MKEMALSTNNGNYNLTIKDDNLPDRNYGDLSYNLNIDNDEKTMGLYYPVRFPNKSKQLLTKDLLRNKNGDFDAAKRLANAMHLIMKTLFPKFMDVDMIVPVPNHSDKYPYKSSGKFLAENLHDLIMSKHKKNDILFNDLLIKNKNIHMTGFTERSERSKIIQGLFSLKPGYELRNRSVLLIDDITTTGNTLNKCKELLNDAGTSNVYTYCAAKTYWHS